VRNRLLSWQKLLSYSQDLWSRSVFVVFLLLKKGKIMRVEDVMTRDVQTCRPETDLSAVAMQMLKGDCGVLPVVTAAQEVVGMITDRDICMAAATKHCDPARIRVGEVISGNVYACSPETEIHTALNIMRQKQVRRLPVVDGEDGKLLGVLSINDIALKAQGGLRADLSAQDVETTLRAICAHRALPLAMLPPQSLAQIVVT
jgi:CBS domain-containing protein